MGYKLNLLAWSLSGLVVIAAVLAWGQELDWQLNSLSAYRLFPLLGLIAFSLMWAHYLMSALRQAFGVDKAVLTRYFEATSWAVLVALLLHPGLLVWQLWRDGFGLPPKSVYTGYVASSLAWIVILGVVSWAAFLVFELRRKFAARKWWKFVGYTNDAAILAIFYHGLALGRHLQGGWYRELWLFYGISLVASLLYIYYRRVKEGI